MYTEEKPNLPNLKTVFEIGHGKVSIGCGSVTYGDKTLCAISISNLDKSYEIGKDINNVTSSDDIETILTFDNIEGLNVLKESIKVCEDFLINKENYKNESKI